MPKLLNGHWRDDKIQQSENFNSWLSRIRFIWWSWLICLQFADERFGSWMSHRLHGLPRSCIILILQVVAFMRGNAVNGTIVGSLNGVGTPNLLLQTDLSTQPTVTIAPASLAPVVLFEGSFGTASTQTITLTNSDTNNTSVNYQVKSLRSLRPLTVYMLICDIRHCQGHSVRQDNNGAGECMAWLFLTLKFYWEARKLYEDVLDVLDLSSSPAWCGNR